MHCMPLLPMHWHCCSHSPPNNVSLFCRQKGVVLNKFQHCESEKVNMKLFIYFTHLIVFSIIPAPTVLCWDTLPPTEFEAEVALTSFLTASAGASYIQAGAHLGTAISTWVIMAVLTTLKGWEGRKRGEERGEGMTLTLMILLQSLFATISLILITGVREMKAGSNKATHGRM